MLKLYLQIFLILLNSFGILFGSVWLVLTYLYFSHATGTDQDISLDYTKILACIIMLMVNAACLVLSIKWYNRCRAQARERLERYKEVGGS